MTTIPSEAAAGMPTGGVKTLLRIEGVTLFVGMSVLYGVWGGSWWIYAALFLVPDLSLLAYLAGPKAGPQVPLDEHRRRHHHHHHLRHQLHRLPLRHGLLHHPRRHLDRRQLLFGDRPATDSGL